MGGVSSCVTVRLQWCSLSIADRSPAIGLSLRHDAG
jgi:hypothetical protein